MLFISYSSEPNYRHIIVVNRTPMQQLPFLAFSLSLLNILCGSLRRLRACEETIETEIAGRFYRVARVEEEAVVAIKVVSDNTRKTRICDSNCA